MLWFFVMICGISAWVEMLVFGGPTWLVLFAFAFLMDICIVRGALNGHECMDCARTKVRISMISMTMIRLHIAQLGFLTEIRRWHWLAAIYINGWMIIRYSKFFPMDPFAVLVHPLYVQILFLAGMCTAAELVTEGGPDWLVWFAVTCLVEFMGLLLKQNDVMLCSLYIRTKICYILLDDAPMTMFQGGASIMNCIFTFVYLYVMIH